MTDKKKIKNTQFFDLLVAKSNSMLDKNKNNTIIANWLREEITNCKMTKDDLDQIVKDSHKMGIDEMIISEIKKQIKRMTDKPKLDEDRKKQLEDRLFKRNELITEEGEEAVISWIDENQVTRAEAEQIADYDGTFLEERLSIMLDRIVEEEGAIFVDDVVEEETETRSEEDIQQEIESNIKTEERD